MKYIGIKERAGQTCSGPASMLRLLVVAGLLLSGCGRSSEQSRDDHAGDEHYQATGRHDDAEQHHDDHADAGGRTEIVLASAAVASVGLETVAVVESPVGASQELPGRVVPLQDQEALVTSLLAGRLEKVLVNEGDYVRVGQPVAVMTGPELGDIIAELRHSRADLERQRRLTERGVGVRKSLLEAETAYDAARQHLRAIGLTPEEVEAIATGEHEAVGVHLRAPIDGIILKRTATQGGPVSPGQVLFHLADLTPIWVEADVYEQDLALLQQGMHALVHTLAGSDRVHEGKVRQILPKVDRERRVVTVRVELPNEGEILKPGMYVSVRVTTAGEIQPALPVDAILTDGVQSYVIVAENDSTFRRVDVAASADGAGLVPVPELSSGTSVVTTGAFQIHSAMRGVEAGHAH